MSLIVARETFHMRYGMPGVMHVPSMFGPTNKFNSIQLEVEQFRAPSIDNFLPFRGTILIGQLLKAS